MLPFLEIIFSRWILNPAIQQLHSQSFSQIFPFHIAPEDLSDPRGYGDPLILEVLFQSFIISLVEPNVIGFERSRIPPAGEVPRLDRLVHDPLEVGLFLFLICTVFGLGV